MLNWCASPMNLLSTLRKAKFCYVIPHACGNFRTAVGEGMLQISGLVKEGKRCYFMLVDGHCPLFRNPFIDQLCHEHCNTQHISESQNNKHYSQMNN
jgi:hypothetical protein